MEPGRSASPFLGSDAGAASDDTSVNGKGKGKSKSKRAGKSDHVGETSTSLRECSDEAEFNLKRKQVGKVRAKERKDKLLVVEEDAIDHHPHVKC